MFSQFRKHRETELEGKLVFGLSPTLDEELDRLDGYIPYLRSLKKYEGQLFTTILVNLHALSDIEKPKRIVPRLLKLNFVDTIARITEHFHVQQHKSLDNGGNHALLKYALCIYTLWNFTDKALFAKAVADTNLIPVIASNLTHPKIIGCAKEKPSRSAEHVPLDNLSRGSMGMLFNVIQNCPECKTMFLEYGIDKIVAKFLNDDDLSMRLHAVFTLAFLIDENEADKLEDNGSIELVVTLIRDALASDNHRYECEGTSYEAEELLHGLARMAINDDHKMKIVEVGGLDVLAEAMKSVNEKEQECAVRTVYSLCFKSSKEKVKNHTKCKEILYELTKSANKEVRKEAEGALWQLKLSQEDQGQNNGGSVNQHIFISYSWANKDIVWPLSERLKKAGYKVWIDKDEMKGSTLDAMADAVEKAWVVLICMSAIYKDRPDCRSEAQYTYQMHKPVVPILLQRKYRPDGWLGFITASKLYIDFTKFAFDEAVQRLVKQIEVHKPVNTSEDVVDGPVTASVAPSQYASPPAPPSQVTRQYAAEHWTEEQVQEWLTSSKLRTRLRTKMLEFFDDMDGEMLVGICWLKNKVPEYFIKQMTQDYDASIKEVTHLLRALDKLH